MTFANRLKIAMAERGMNQSELAAQIGKGKSSVSQYLSGVNTPKPDVQLKIAQALSCTVAYLNSDIPVGDRSDKGLKNVSVAQAAKQLGKSEQFVRVALQMGTAPFGFAAKNKTVWSYHISPKKLNEYISA